MYIQMVLMVQRYNQAKREGNWHGHLLEVERTLATGIMQVVFLCSLKRWNIYQKVTLKFALTFSKANLLFTKGMIKPIE